LHVAITGRSQESVDTALEKLNSDSSSKAIGFPADVRSFEEQESAIEKTIAQLGAVDIVIANAGLGHFGKVQDLSIEDWKETIDTNLTGAFYTLKASVDQLIKQKGYYITISSLAGTNFFSGGVAYNASKFGVTGFTQAAMLDLRDAEVKVTTIMPGSVSTHFNGNEPSEKGSWKIQIEDIGQMVVDLLKMNPRTLPSKIEVRPTTPPSK
ncbi:MAG: SDR family oxidoreductase, partial [Flavobacteriaceae bacterium]|nr:SDR family oxidoreductase [Flavobacteriaceae bacterium]